VKANALVSQRVTVREAFLRRQHQALRWTFLGSAMRNPNFQAALGALKGSAKARVEAAANAFC